MKKAVKFLARLLLEVVIVTVLVVGIRVLTGGMWLFGLPNLKDIQSVSISYPNVTEEVKEISSSEDIELALKLTGFLKYNLFEQTDDDEPLMTFTYHLKDGKEKTISANDHTVWWEGKSYSIKDKETFINLAEGIFFLDDLQKK